MRVTSENSLFLAQVIVNAFVVLVNVAASAESRGKVTVRIVFQSGRRHREVGQKGLSRAVNSVLRNNVPREGSPASGIRAVTSGVSVHAACSRVVQSKPVGCAT